MMHLGWPQVIVCVFVGINLGINLANDGRPRKGEYSFVFAVVRAAVLCSLLYWGGFFG